MDLKGLAASVAAEKSFIREAHASRLAFSPVEQRKQGILLYPLTIVSQLSNGAITEVQFTTSFPINEQFFRRGAAVKCMQQSWSAEGRLQEIHAYGGMFSLFEDEVPNLRDEPVTLQFIPDDRTLFCMELGCRLAVESKTLTDIRENLGVEKDFLMLYEDVTLNVNQQKAAGAILGNDPAVLIQGPPGTGKTHTLSVAIRELVKQDKRVIITAPSNTAVDHLCHQLVASNVPILRVGNEEKMSAVTERYTISGYLENGTGKRLIEHLRKELRKAEDLAGKFIRNYTRESAAEKQEARKEMRSLRKEIRESMRAAKEDLLQRIPVIAGTPVGLFNELPKDFLTDVVIIDEAGQCLEPLAWLAASFGKRLVLCGDPQQLAPLVFSPEARKAGLDQSLLERAMRPGNSLLLDHQYRMAPEIVAGVNPHFYNDQLKTVFADRKGQLLFVDMAGFGEGDEQDETSGSTFHRDEADVVGKLVEHFGLPSTGTVVLSPYNAQLAKLQAVLGPQWKISTIDSIQGQEADHIVISLTRSNATQDIGFLKDYRRTNVAITRARYTCILVGDSATLGNDPFYGELIRFIEDSGGYHSAWEYS